MLTRRRILPLENPTKHDGLLLHGLCTGSHLRGQSNTENSILNTEAPYKLVEGFYASQGGKQLSGGAMELSINAREAHISYLRKARQATLRSTHHFGGGRKHRW